MFLLGRINVCAVKYTRVWWHGFKYAMVYLIVVKFLSTNVFVHLKP